MNLFEYKSKKLKEVRRFLRDLNFDNIGIKDKNIIEHVTPECSDFFNKDETYRKITEGLLIRIKEHYSNLVDIDLEYAGSIEEIDKEIKKFVEKIRKEVDSYKHTLIKATFQPQKEEEEEVKLDSLVEVKEKNLLNTGLNFIKLKVGDNIYSSLKTHAEAEKEDAVLDNLNYMIIYIYALVGMIKDKKEKQEEFIDFIAQNFKVTDEEYLKLRRLQGIFLNEKNYEEFIKKYNVAIEEVVSTIIERDEREKTDAPKLK